MIKSIIYTLTYIIFFIVAAIVLFINLAPQFGSNPSSEQKVFYDSFPNYSKGGFKNFESTPMMTGEISTWDFFKEDSSRKPRNAILPKSINFGSFAKISNNYRFAWLGHSAFLINIMGKIILLDPMLGSHAAPIPLPNLKRFNEVLPIKLDSVDRIDFVVISHDHYDHLDYSTIKLLKDKVSTFLAPHGIGNHLKRWGVKSNQIVELNWNESFNAEKIEFHCLPSRHFSGRGPLNRNSTLWSSWAIKSPPLKIYFSGDSGYGKHLKDIGDKHGPFDISLIDCGQYNNAWKHSHMFPSEAVLAAQDLNTKVFLPIHWGVFTLAMHSWDEPARESIKYAEKVGLKYYIPEIGEIISEENFNLPINHWWERY